MIELDIPGFGALRLEHLVLDLNGTVALDGDLLPGVADAVAGLSGSLRVHVLTADMHGRGSGIAEALGAELTVVGRGDEARHKLAFVEELGPEKVVAIGNGANDEWMLDAARVGVAVVGGEGASARAVASADVVVTDVLVALGLLGHPHRLLATLRS